MDDRSVTFLWKDYAHSNQPKLMTLEAGEFLRRFLMHAAPTGFMRIRHFGLLANRFRTANLARCRELLATAAPTHHIDPPDPIYAADGREHCPVCSKGRMIRTEFIRAVVISPAPRLDSS